ncbi:hypothetical protein C0J52_21385, partial [Blattella germanica]
MLKPFQCETCKDTFPDSGSFNKHIRTHGTPRPHKCDICKRAFTMSSHLTAHYRTHTGSRPFECEVCKKKFRHISSLNVHYRIHNGSRPFECVLCKKAFTDSSSLTKHHRTHTGFRPFQCDVCKLPFGRKDNLRRHVLKHTRGLEITPLLNTITVILMISIKGNAVIMDTQKEEKTDAKDFEVVIIKQEASEYEQLMINDGSWKGDTLSKVDMKEEEFKMESETVLENASFTSEVRSSKQHKALIKKSSTAINSCNSPLPEDDNKSENLINHPVDNEQVFGDYVASELRQIKIPANERMLRRLINEMEWQQFYILILWWQNCMTELLLPDDRNYSRTINMEEMVLDIATQNFEDAYHLIVFGSSDTLLESLPFPRLVASLDEMHTNNNLCANAVILFINDDVNHLSNVPRKWLRAYFILVAPHQWNFQEMVLDIATQNFEDAYHLIVFGSSDALLESLPFPRLVASLDEMHTNNNLSANAVILFISDDVNHLSKNVPRKWLRAYFILVSPHQWNFQEIANVILLLTNDTSHNSVQAFTFNPYQLHSCQLVQPVLMDKLWFPKVKVANLQNCHLNFTLIELAPDVIVPNKRRSLSKWHKKKNHSSSQEGIFNINDNNLAGVEVELVQTLAEKMNFTPSYSLPRDGSHWGYLMENGTITGMSGDVFKRMSDQLWDLLEYSSTLGMDCYGWGIPLGAGHRIPSWKTLTSEFSTLTWGLIFLALCLSAMCMWALSHRDARDRHRYRIPCSTFCFTCNTMITAPSTSQPESIGVR